MARPAAHLTALVVGLALGPAALGGLRVLEVDASPAAVKRMEDLLPGEDDPRRAVVREWIAAHPEASARELAESGYVAPHWPAPWGLGADPVHQLIIDDEFQRAGVKRPSSAG